MSTFESIFKIILPEFDNIYQFSSLVALSSGAQILIEMLIKANKTEKLSIFAVSLILLASISSTASYYFLTNEQYRILPIVVSSFILSIFIWTLTFHILLANYGSRITKFSIFGYTRIFENWVKAIDYIYLGFTSLGVVRIVVGMIEGTSHGKLDAIAAIVIGFAVSLRVTRTSVEIFGWDKAPLSDG